MARFRMGGLVTAILLACARLGAASPLDAIVGAVGASAVTASDIALARAFSLFGFAPSDAPIRRVDVDRYTRALVAAREASRLGIGPTPAELDQAWATLETQMGGGAALRAWLDATTIDTAWARRALDEHLRWRSWTTLHEGLTIETPGAAPPPPALESDVALRNLLPSEHEIPVPFAMPSR